MTPQPRRAAHRKPRRVTRSGGSVLTGGGLVLALWFGMTAPNVSPVAAPAAPADRAHSVTQTVLDPSGADTPAVSGR
jgi:hypothetical protein